MTREGIPMIKDERSVQSIAQTLNFLRQNVLNISDVTRKKKLTTILNSFAGTTSEEIFVVQNSKSKDAQGALIDVDYLLELLNYKAIVEEYLGKSIDQMLVRTVQEREDAVATKTIGEVADQFELTWDDIMEAKGRVGID